jgi:glycosyltransferase involved in cell wall biosynthesis
VQDLLARCLPELRFEVCFACLKPNRFPDMRQAQDAPLWRVPMRSRFDLRAAWHVARIIREERCRLLHTHTPRSAMIGRLAARLAGVPMVCHVHSPALRDTTHGLRNRVNALVERWGLGGASRLIAVSQSLGRYLEALGFDPSKARVVPNGVPVCEGALPRTRPHDRWTLGTVALFRPRKGIEVLLEALAILKQERLPVRLRAVGPFETAPYKAAIKARAARLGLSDSIEWSGLCADVNTQLAQMDLFVLPSLFGEGLPMVVLEAMAAGVPVVATRVEGVPEAVRDAREGVLARPGDPGDLARSIGRVICGDLDWAELRAGARVRQAEMFSDRAMAAGVAGVYNELLCASPASDTT